MSSPAVIDFAVFEGEEICCDAEGRRSASRRATFYGWSRLLQQNRWDRLRCTVCFGTVAMDYGRPDQHELAGGRSGVCGPAQAVVSVLLLESADVPWFRDDLTGVRLAASRLARRTGPSEHRAGAVALAVSEAVLNLAKHAADGVIVLLPVDRGPGMADAAAATRAGHTSAGAPGIGLGIVTRLSDTSDLHSLPGQGTVLLARFWPHDVRSRHPGSSPDLPNAIGTAKAGGTAVDLVRPRAMPLRIFRP
jgi:anti-sigma regulatory factor (Ser/Thr protein kinase)